MIVVPGNPGSGLYYKSFIEQLNAQFDGQVDILVPSHLAHDLGSPHGELVCITLRKNAARGTICTVQSLYLNLCFFYSLQLVDLDGQIQHKVDFLKEHVLLPGRPPVVLMGHSIGCFIALHAMPLLEAELHQDAPTIMKVPCVSRCSSACQCIMFHEVCRISFGFRWSACFPSSSRTSRCLVSGSSTGFAPTTVRLAHAPAP